MPDSHVEIKRRCAARKRGEDVPLRTTGPKPRVKVAVGEIYRNLRVVEYLGQANRGEAIWRCKCECGCGKERTIKSGPLRAGRASCKRRAFTPEEMHDRKTKPRECRLCKKMKQPDEYRRYKGLVCKKCDRRRLLMKNYGLTLEDFDQMLLDQDGKCYICRNPPTNDEEVLCVDHNHLTKQVRKLLCFSCNSAIGYLRENPQTALGVLHYLVEHGAKFDLTSITNYAMGSVEDRQVSVVG